MDSSSPGGDHSPGAACTCGAPAGPRGKKRRQVLDWFLFAVALGLGWSLLRYSAILPNARRAERLERRAYALEREVDSTAREVSKLRSEVTALQSDPYTIERTLKRRLRSLRPDLFEERPAAPERHP